MPGRNLAEAPASTMPKLNVAADAECEMHEWLDEAVPTAPNNFFDSISAVFEERALEQLILQKLLKSKSFEH